MAPLKCVDCKSTNIKLLKPETIDGGKRLVLWCKCRDCDFHWAPEFPLETLYTREGGMQGSWAEDSEDDALRPPTEGT